MGLGGGFHQFGRIRAPMQAQEDDVAAPLRALKRPPVLAVRLVPQQVRRSAHSHRVALKRYIAHLS